ncbi:phosphotransferase [Paracoccus limosus]|uniref:Phosphotransferase n=1 Tax=Paracoccus limosus TaxID=913252 RepID=A0A844H7X2_9RHOB|nr:phosphotransferase [Paracoccus limosus]MTH35733.1 phosphotransferase [Paracoccus limosus]
MQLPPALRDLPALAGASAVALLRDLPQRQVWRIRLQGKPAYLKHFLGPDRQQAARGAEARLREAGAALGQGRNGAVQPLLLIAWAGVLVTEPAPGLTLGEALRTAPAHAPLLARAGEWLAGLAAPSREAGSFGPRFWIDGLHQRLEATPRDWLDAGLVATHLSAMQEQAPDLRQARVERARMHGDPTGDNLFHDAASDRMTAIDMQDWGPIAVARDVARLLVWVESRSTTDAPRRINGIAAADYLALTGVSGLLSADQGPILRFMIGELLLSYYLESGRQAGRRAALARAMQAWAQPSSASAAS